MSEINRLEILSSRSGRGREIDRLAIEFRDSVLTKISMASITHRLPPDDRVDSLATRGKREHPRPNSQDLLQRVVLQRRQGVLDNVPKLLKMGRKCGGSEGPIGLPPGARQQPEIVNSHSPIGDDLSPLIISVICYSSADE